MDNIKNSAITDNDALKKTLRMDSEPKAPWYHGELSRDAADKLLKDEIPGTFLVRYSDNAKQLTVAYRDKDKCVHALIFTGVSGHTFGNSISQRTCSSLKDLIEYHKKHPIITFQEERTLLLLYPVCVVSMDTLLGRLSRRFPFQELHQVFMDLGLTQEDIAQVQIDNNNNVEKQTLSLLLKWKTRAKNIEDTLKERNFDLKKLYGVDTSWRDGLSNGVIIDQLSADKEGLKDICDHAASKFLELGIELGLEENYINNCEQDCRKCKVTVDLVVREWLQRLGPWATWAAIGDAMFEVGADVEFIQKKYQ